MDLQLTIAGLLVAGSVLYLIRVMSRSWRADKGNCGGGCGCKTAQVPRQDSLIPSHEIVMRKRVGEPGA